MSAPACSGRCSCGAAFRAASVDALNDKLAAHYATCDGRRPPRRRRRDTGAAAARRDAT